MAFATIAEGLAHLERHERAFLSLGKETMSAGGGALFTLDLYVMGAVKRSLAVSAGFRALVSHQNLLCAGALLRMQLETALRFFGVGLTTKPQEVALLLLGGAHLRKMKDRDGQLMTDAYLARRLSEHAPWVQRVYQETSKFVHFTEKQIFAALVSVDDETRSFQMLLSRRDEVEDSVVLEAIEAFDAATRLLGGLIHEWKELKNTPHQPASKEKL